MPAPIEMEGSEGMRNGTGDRTRSLLSLLSLASSAPDPFSQIAAQMIRWNGEGVATLR